MRHLALILGWFLLWVHPCSFASIQDHFTSIQNQPDKLYRLLKDMPKGGELHYHYDGSVYAENMLQLTKNSRYCIHPIHFNTQPCQENPSLLSIKKAIASAPTYQKIIHAWSMQNFVPSSESGQDHFFKIFPKVGLLYENFRGPFLAAILEKAAVQQELYMEIIAYGLNPDARYLKLIQSAPTFEKQRAILIANKTFQQDVKKIVRHSELFLEQAHQALHCDRHPQQAACHINVRYQFYVRRTLPIHSVFVQALAGFMAAEQSSQIVAVNLVGAEDDAISQRDYKSQMEIFAMLHQYYPKVHIALHAGELFPMHIRKHLVESPIREAIVIGHAERIGHGLDISEEPKADQLAQMMREKSIPVEVNLTSNQLLYNVRGKQHPLTFYLQHQVPIVLSTDDEGILRTDLTKEYVKAVTEYHLDYATLKQINRNSLTYAFIPGESLWKNPQHAQRVPACQNLQSLLCQNWIKRSPKATLQWALEKKLMAFEGRY